LRKPEKSSGPEEVTLENKGQRNLIQ